MTVPWVFNDYIFLIAVVALILAQPFHGYYKHQYDAVLVMDRGAWWLSHISFMVIWVFVWMLITAATFMYGQQANPSSDYYMSIIIITIGNVLAQKHWEYAFFRTEKHWVCKTLTFFLFVSAWVIFGLLVTEILNLNNNRYIIASTICWGIAASWFTYVCFFSYSLIDMVPWLHLHDPERVHYEKETKRTLDNLKEGQRWSVEEHQHHMPLPRATLIHNEPPSVMNPPYPPHHYGPHPQYTQSRLLIPRKQ